MTTNLRIILGVVIAVGGAAVLGVWAEAAPSAAKSGSTAVHASAAISPFEIMLKSGRDIPDANPMDLF